MAEARARQSIPVPLRRPLSGSYTASYVAGRQGRPPHEGNGAEDGPQEAGVHGEPGGLQVDDRPDGEAVPRHLAVGCTLGAKTMYVGALFRMTFLISENVLVCVCSKPESGAGGPMRRWPKGSPRNVAREAPLVDLMEIFNIGRPKPASGLRGPCPSFQVATLIHSHTFDIGKTGLNRVFASPFCYTIWSRND